MNKIHQNSINVQKLFRVSAWTTRRLIFMLRKTESIQNKGNREQMKEIYVKD